MPIRSSAAVKRFAVGTPPPLGVVTLTPFGAVTVVPAGAEPLPADEGAEPVPASADASGDASAPVSSLTRPAVSDPDVFDDVVLPPLHAIANIPSASSNATNRDFASMVPSPFYVTSLIARSAYVFTTVSMS
jgi:hypothetical protein